MVGNHHMANTTEIIDELCKGIVRIVYVDEHSVEHENNFTLCRNHLPEECDDNWLVSIVRHPLIAMDCLFAFNVVTEKTEKLFTKDIIEIERITGAGVKKDKDRVGFIPQNVLDLIGGDPDVPSGDPDDEDDDWFDEPEYEDLEDDVHGRR